MNQRFKSTLPPKIGVVQMKPTLGEKYQNLATMEAFIKQAKAQQVELLIFPELCLTGYVLPEGRSFASLVEPAEGGCFDFLANLAKRYGLYLIYGFPEIDRGLLYNAQNFIGPTGKRITTYRKTHLFYADEGWARSGLTGYQNFVTDIGVIGLGICMDMNFESFLHFHIQHHSHVVAVSSYWLEDQANSLHYWCARWSIFSGVVGIANAYGQEGGFQFSGNSCILENGLPLAVVRKKENSLLLSSSLRLTT